MCKYLSFDENCILTEQICVNGIDQGLYIQSGLARVMCGNELKLKKEAYAHFNYVIIMTPLMKQLLFLETAHIT